MEQWTVDKIIAAARCIIHQENMPVISEETLGRYRTIQTTYKTDLEEMLKVIFTNEKEQLEIYGTVEEICEDLKTLGKLPEMIKYSKNNVTELCEEYIHNANGMKLMDSNKVGYYSKQDVALFFFKHAMRHFLVGKQVIVFAMLFYNAWFLSFFNKIRENLKGCYEFVSESTWTEIESEIDSMLLKRNTENQNRSVSLELFSKLRSRLNPKDESLLELPLQNLKQLIKEDPIKKNKQFYNHIYSCVEIMINETEKIYQKYIEVFTPFSGSQKLSKFQLPVVRSFQIYSQKFYLAKELENALEVAIKRRDSKKSLPRGLVRVENESDRKKGVVFSVSNKKLQEILKKLGLTENDLNICMFPVCRDYQLSFHPILSSYETHCKPALHVLDSMIYYITIVLKYLESSNEQCTKKLLSWMLKFDSLFTQEDNLYFIETWRIERLFNQAKKELKISPEEEYYHVTRKEYYTNEEVLHEVSMLGKHIPLDVDTIIEALMYLTLDDPNRNYTTIKDVYSCYSRAVKSYILSKNKKMARFVDNQVAHLKKNKTESKQLEEKEKKKEEKEEEKKEDGKIEKEKEKEEKEEKEDGNIEKEKEKQPEPENDTPIEPKKEKRQQQRKSISQYFRENISVIIVVIPVVIMFYNDPKKIWKLFTFL